METNRGTGILATLTTNFVSAWAGFGLLHRGWRFTNLGFMAQWLLLGISSAAIEYLVLISILGAQKYFRASKPISIYCTKTLLAFYIYFTLKNLTYASTFVELLNLIYANIEILIVSLIFMLILRGFVCLTVWASDKKKEEKKIRLMLFNKTKIGLVIGINAFTTLVMLCYYFVYDYIDVNAVLCSCHNKGMTCTREDMIKFNPSYYDDV
jgi:hypothetical protein